MFILTYTTVLGKRYGGLGPLQGPVLRHICIFSKIDNILAWNVRNALFMKQDRKEVHSQTF